MSPKFLFDAPLDIFRDAEESGSLYVRVRLKTQHELAESAVAPAATTDVTSKAGTTGSSLVSRSLDFLFSLAPFSSSSSLHRAPALVPGTPGVALLAFIAMSAQRTPRSVSTRIERVTADGASKAGQTFLFQCLYPPSPFRRRMEK